MIKQSLKHRIDSVSRLISGTSRKRGSVIKKVANAFELVYFGTVYYDDEMTPIKGFTLSTSYVDQHFCVGQFEGYEVRMVDRYDSVYIGSGKKRQQNWCIIEVSLETSGFPRICMVPTGPTSQEYTRFFTSHTKFQPLNTALFQQHSSELHGRFQILASPSRTHDVEEILTTPIVMGISARFWPYGIEIYKDKLYVYITDKQLSSEKILSAVESSLWLADSLDHVQEHRD